MVSSHGQGWNHYPFQWYRQLWAQLETCWWSDFTTIHTLSNNHGCNSPILPTSLHQDALLRNHDETTQQGTREHLSILGRNGKRCGDTAKNALCANSVNWVYQIVHLSPACQLPNHEKRLSQSSLSTNNNRYLLVVQGKCWSYTTPWRYNMRISQVVSMYGYPEILHSYQDHNFAFGICKTQTMACHPEGNCIDKRFNRFLLQLLWTYAHIQDGWENHLPLVLYTYHTSVHSWAWPFLLMYGHNLSCNSMFSLKMCRIREGIKCRQFWKGELHDFLSKQSGNGSSLSNTGLWLSYSGTSTFA